MEKTGKIKSAVALGYDRERDQAPRVLAKGKGILAEKIIEAARKHGIPLREDPVLVEMLARLEVDSEIPPALYRAVAEVLAYVYQTQAKQKGYR